MSIGRRVYPTQQTKQWLSRTGEDESEHRRVASILETVGRVLCHRCGAELAKIKTSSVTADGGRLSDLTVDFDPEPVKVPLSQPLRVEWPGGAVEYRSLDAWLCRRCRAPRGIDYDRALSEARGKIRRQVQRRADLSRVQRVTIRTLRAE